MALPKYYIPRDLESAVIEIESAASPGGDAYVSTNKFYRVLIKLKNIDCLEIAKCHYLQLLKLALYLEELQQRKDMNKFEMHKLTIKKAEDTKKKFKICIKDINEDNSPLNISDSLKVYEQSNSEKVYFLKVSKICNGHVMVTADDRFCKDHTDSAEYSVKLIFNTYSFQCCHYALSEADSSIIADYFFPKKTIAISKQLGSSNQTWFNQDVLVNPEQKQAVINIVNKSAFPAPYVLYGPPGTGKTSTLVEAICQIWKKQTGDYILICAPSNAACDVVTKRLLVYISADNVYRIYSQSQDYVSIDKDIKKCCNYKGDGVVDDLEKVDLSSKRIIITTLCTSLRLKKVAFPKGSTFSHVFIDEASQATLPEAFLPICASNRKCSTISRNFQIVISGDHQQLAPGIRSKLAEPLLGQSILEKLMKHDPYKKDRKTGYDPRYVTKLIRNFRSSEAIIHVPNALFYDNELIACSNTNSNCFPIAFHAVKGKERKTTDSKSSYNQDEINEVLEHVKKFVGKRKGNKVINTKDIGIVTPFRLQASQIRKRLNRTPYKDVDVGTVEVYQGQEKEVIIVSTVRSKTFVHNGIEHIGFLSNPKRFNVALTRAKSFLVVVGSPSVLETDKNWRYFLRFCQENNACHGDSFLMRDELYYSMRELSIGSKCTNSIDLFESTLKILTTDDGRMMKNGRKLIKFSPKVTPTISHSTANSNSTNTITLRAVTPNTSRQSSMGRSIVNSSTNFDNYSRTSTNSSIGSISFESARSNYNFPSYGYTPHKEKKKSLCNIL